MSDQIETKKTKKTNFKSEFEEKQKEMANDLAEIREIYDDPASQLELDHIEKTLEPYLKLGSLKIGVFGATGVGKSATINSLLKFHTDLLPSGNRGKAVTGTVVELSSVDREGFAVQVDFFPLELWDKMMTVYEQDEIESLNGMDKEHVQNLKNIGSEILENLWNGREIPESSEVKGKYLLYVPEEMREQFQKGSNTFSFPYADEEMEKVSKIYILKENAWSYLVEKVTISGDLGKFQGISLLDVPGSGDGSDARDNKFQSCLKSCDIVLYVAQPARFMEHLDVFINHNISILKTKKMALVLTHCSNEALFREYMRGEQRNYTVLMNRIRASLPATFQGSKCPPDFKELVLSNMQSFLVDNFCEEHVFQQEFHNLRMFCEDFVLTEQGWEERLRSFRNCIDTLLEPSISDQYPLAQLQLQNWTEHLRPTTYSVDTFFRQHRFDIEGVVERLTPGRNGNARRHLYKKMLRASSVATLENHRDKILWDYLLDHFLDLLKMKDVKNEFVTKLNEISAGEEVIPGGGKVLNTFLACKLQEYLEKSTLFLEKLQVMERFKQQFFNKLPVAVSLMRDNIALINEFLFNHHEEMIEMLQSDVRDNFFSYDLAILHLSQTPGIYEEVKNFRHLASSKVVKHLLQGGIRIKDHQDNAKETRTAGSSSHDISYQERHKEFEEKVRHLGRKITGDPEIDKYKLGRFKKVYNAPMKSFYLAEYPKGYPNVIKIGVTEKDTVKDCYAKAENVPEGIQQIYLRASSQAFLVKSIIDKIFDRCRYQEGHHVSKDWFRHHKLCKEVVDEVCDLVEEYVKFRTSSSCPAQYRMVVGKSRSEPYLFEPFPR